MPYRLQMFALIVVAIVVLFLLLAPAIMAQGDEYADPGLFWDRSSMRNALDIDTEATLRAIETVLAQYQNGDQIARAIEQYTCGFDVQVNNWYSLKGMYRQIQTEYGAVSPQAVTFKEQVEAFAQAGN